MKAIESSSDGSVTKPNSGMASHCSKCNLLLSVFPIISINNQTVCGRCIDDVRKQVQKEGRVAVEERNAVLEENIVFICFPCRYSYNGCTKHLTPLHMKFHEENCPYRTYTCSITGCETILTMVDMQNHIYKAHLKLVNDSGYLENITYSQTYQIALKYDKILFLADIKNPRISTSYSTAFKPEIAVTVVGPTNVADNYSFNVEYGTNCDLYENPVQPYDKCEHVPLKELTGKYNLHVFITKKLKQTNEKNPSDVTCRVCTHHMTGAIYQCKNGHTICQKCESTIKFCCTCGGEYCSRNIFLEKLAKSTNDTFCNYSDCTDVPIVDKDHLLVCPFVSYNCAICGSDLSNYIKLVEHLSNEHKNEIKFDSIITIKSNISESKKAVHFLMYNKNLFKIVEQSENFMLKLSVHLIAPRNNQNIYTWHLSNSSEPKEWISLKRQCSRGVEIAEDFYRPRTFVTLTRDLMAPFLINDTFSYTINIVSRT